MVQQYAIALIISAAISALVAFIAWQRRSAPGAVGLCLAMLGMVIWASTYSVRWLQTEPSRQMYWLDATYLGVVIVPTAFMILTLQYTNRSHLLTRRNLSLFAIEPLLTLAFIFTDQYHGLFYAGHRTTGTILDGGFWFWINLIYSYSMLLVALILLFQMFFSSQHFFRQQAGVMVLGMLMPWISNIISLSKLSPFPQLDLTPFMFIVSGLIFANGLFRFHLLDIVPVARNRLVESMNDGVIVLDGENRIVDVNPAALRIIDGNEDLIGKPPDVALPFWSDLNFSLKSKSDLQVEIRLGDLYYHDYEVRISPLLDRNGNVYGHLLIMRDITKRKQAEIRLKQSEEKYRQLIENATEMIVVVQDMKIKFCNPMTCEITGYSEEELTSSPFTRFVYSEDQEFVRNNHLKRLRGELSDLRYEFRLFTKNNQIKWVEVSGIKIDWEGKPASLNFLSDITSRKEVEQALKYQSSHDILTGLFNRQYFESEMVRLQSSRFFPISILMMDVDGLKAVNDQYGHHAGDELLRHVSEVLKNTFRPEDMIARIGGDEFIVVLPLTDENGANRALMRLRKKLETYNQNLPDGQILNISTGAATAESHHGLLSALKIADENMYLEKNQKKVNLL